MKKSIKFLIFIVLSFMFLNICEIYAEENENQNNIEMVDTLPTKDELIKEEDSDVFEKENENVLETNDENTFETSKEQTDANSKENNNNNTTSDIVSENGESITPDNNDDPKDNTLDIVPEGGKETTPDNNDNSNDNTLGTNSKDEDKTVPDNKEVPDTTNNNDNVQNKVQKVEVITKKTDTDGNMLSGAKLQILDSDNNIVDEWISDENPRKTLLPEGNYTLHEVEAPEGYDLAEDIEFTITVEIEVGYAAKTLNPNIPCETATTYYVEIKGEKHEVYCINQFLTEPGPDANYNGSILTPETIRNYTQQIVYKDPEYNPGGEGAIYNHGHLTDEPIDVSDTSLSNQELYDTLLNIIYRRTLARSQDKFSDTEALPDEAISFITEMALKTYTNAGVTQIQRWDSIQSGDEAIYVKEGNYYWYLMHMYKDYKYDPESPNGFRTIIGQGDAFGNFARHWTQKNSLHGTNNLSVDHPIYADFFYFLLGDEVSNSLVHPDDMHIYIYNALNTAEDGEKYQNLLGITGYLEDVTPKAKEITMKNDYSTEKRDIPVVKIWEDKEDYNELRPNSVTVNLYADGELYETVELNEENNWNHKFENLDVYNKGKKIEYTINEIEVPEYDTQITGDMEIGFTVINTHFGQGGNDEPPTDNPQTADNVMSYIMLLMICLLGLIKSSYSLIKNNNL